MSVPGAVMSGLIRPSKLGPRLLKAAMPSMLFAIKSSLMGLAGNFLCERLSKTAYVWVSFGRRLSLAATVMQFLAIAPDPICRASMIPFAPGSWPSLPAEKQSVISLCFHTKVSISSDHYWSYIDVAYPGTQCPKNSYEFAPHRCRMVVQK